MPSPPYFTSSPIRVGSLPKRYSTPTPWATVSSRPSSSPPKLPPTREHGTNSPHSPNRLNPSSIVTPSILNLQWRTNHTEPKPATQSNALADLHFRQHESHPILPTPPPLDTGRSFHPPSTMGHMLSSPNSAHDEPLLCFAGPMATPLQGSTYTTNRDEQVSPGPASATTPLYTSSKKKKKKTHSPFDFLSKSLSASSLGRYHSLLSHSLISVTLLQLTSRQLPSLTNSTQSRLSRDPFHSRRAVMTHNASAAPNNATPNAFRSTKEAARSSRPSHVGRHIRQTNVLLWIHTSFACPTSPKISAHHSLSAATYCIPMSVSAVFDLALRFFQVTIIMPLSDQRTIAKHSISKLPMFLVRGNSSTVSLHPSL